jgi:hypothetical protein
MVEMKLDTKVERGHLCALVHVHWSARLARPAADRGDGDDCKVDATTMG